jgi:hypothetical protein
VWALALGACGGKTSSAPASGTVDLGAYAATMAAMVCRSVVECGGIGASEEEVCKTDLTRAYASQRFGAVTIGESLAAGRLRISESALSVCARGDGMSCAVLKVFPCPEALVGLVPIGGKCNDDSECGEGYCFYRGQSCADVCKHFASTGARCDRERCAPSDFCDDSQICRPLPGQGDPCVDFHCQRGLWCSSSTRSPPFACTTLPADGQTCTYTGVLCGSGLYCDFPTSLCHPLLEPGSSCSTFASCKRGFTCGGPNDRQTCVPWGDRGTPCDNATGSICPHSMNCDVSAHTCVQSHSFQEGEPCTDNCAGGATADGRRLYCEAETKTCRRAGDLGEHCNASVDAGPFTTSPCIYGQCDFAKSTCASNCP